MPADYRIVARYKQRAVITATGGGGEIRTHDTLASMPVFKTGALNHSATPPNQAGTFLPLIIMGFQRDTGVARVRDR
jgi:hypothetical protein